jgi:hypothetical protein
LNPVNRSLLVVVFILLILSLSIPAFNLSNSVYYAQDVGLPHLTYFPLFGHHKGGLASTSYYLPTVDGDFLYNLGCEQGVQDLRAEGAQDGVAVLDFSYPVYDSDFGYGAALFEDNPIDYPTSPVSIEAIKQAAKQFALGYYHCSGADTQSNLVIGVGTNNKATSIESESRATSHGKAWGAMVADLNQWALEQGILHQAQFYGASNIESWNTPSWTYAWIAGFEQNEDVFLLHFGDAAGCPYDERPTLDCNGDWSVESIWYVSWGAPSALPLPLIYLTNGIHAKQWAFLSRYSVENHGYRMDFTGVFTSWQYCQQFPQWCNGIDNTPEQAYQQMLDELSQEAATAQTLKWKTDIRWIRESEVTGARGKNLEAQTEAATHPIYEEIRKVEAALQEAGLSDTLRASLETKFNIYQSLSVKIQTSQQAPAPKD